MDQEGILPEALKAACKEHKPKAVYLIPTLHNPTTATLGTERRKIIADIIRKNGIFLIEGLACFLSRQEILGRDSAVASRIVHGALHSPPRVAMRSPPKMVAWSGKGCARWPMASVFGGSKKNSEENSEK
jgi:hypothetical protein